MLKNEIIELSGESILREPNIILTDSKEDNEKRYSLNGSSFKSMTDIINYFGVKYPEDWGYNGNVMMDYLVPLFSDSSCSKFVIVIDESEKMFENFVEQKEIFFDFFEDSKEIKINSVLRSSYLLDFFLCHFVFSCYNYVDYKCRRL